MAEPSVESNGIGHLEDEGAVDVGSVAAATGLSVLVSDIADKTRAPQRFQLWAGGKSSLKIGRTPECDVNLTYKGVSGIHAELRLLQAGGGKLLIRDLSTNGTGLKKLGDAPSDPPLCLVKGSDFSVLDGSMLLVPMKLKAGVDTDSASRAWLKIKIDPLSPEEVQTLVLAAEAERVAAAETARSVALVQQLAAATAAPPVASAVDALGVRPTDSVRTSGGNEASAEGAAPGDQQIAERSKPDKKTKAKKGKSRSRSRRRKGKKRGRDASRSSSQSQRRKRRRKKHRRKRSTSSNSSASAADERPAPSAPTGAPGQTGPAGVMSAGQPGMMPSGQPGMWPGMMPTAPRGMMHGATWPMMPHGAYWGMPGMGGTVPNMMPGMHGMRLPGMMAAGRPSASQTS